MHFVYKHILDNDLDAMNPEFWAARGLLVLRKALVVAPLFNRDYSKEVAEFGQVVHVPKKRELSAGRKLPGVDVQAQNIGYDGTLIRLNQQPYVHYTVNDIERSNTIGDAVNDFIDPAFFAVAEHVDRACMLQAYDFFLNQTAGHLTNGLSYSDLVKHNTLMNNLKLPRGTRPMLINNGAEGSLLNEDKLTRADAMGNGSALLTGIIGAGAGFQIVPTLQAPIVGDLANSITAVGAINNSAGYGKGTTVLTVDGFTGARTLGEFCTIETITLGSGRVSVHRILAQTLNTGNTVQITIEPALVESVVNNAVISVWRCANVEDTLAVQAGDNFDITVPAGGFINAGMGISFSAAAGAPVYGVMEATDMGSNVFNIQLNRPLEAAIATNDKCFIFPPVPINFCPMLDACGFVGRPLRIPRGAASAAQALALGMISLRVVFGYDMKAQNDMVTTDTLFGIQTLDRTKGTIAIG
jgi:hypothetical protein